MGKTKSATEDELLRAEMKRDAAEEMYEALKAVQEWLMFPNIIENGLQTWNAEFVKANNLTVAALAKAEGK